MIDRNKTIELLKNMVSINSVNTSLGDGNENELAEFIGQYLSKLGLEITYQKIEGRKNIIAILRGTGDGQSLILNGHTDTVSLEGMDDPLNPIVKDGRIFGRGSYDMKGGLVSFIMALESIINSGQNLSGDVIFAGVVDEEYASIGTEELIKDFSADAAIISEPTNSRVVIANKGFSWFKVIVHGKAAHGSKPHLGIDAIANANKVLNEIKNLQQKLHNKKHPLVGNPDIRVNKINGGLGLSTIADNCELYIERRSLPDVKEEDVVQEINDILTKLRQEDPQFKADMELIIFRPGLELSEDEPIVQVLVKEYENVIGKKPEMSGEPWWMDSALMSEHGIPTVVLGPNGDGAHAKVEYVEIDSVMEIAEVMRKTIISFCK